MAPVLPRYGAALDCKRVGLLGGSFNPAHGGHRHISLEAMKRLRLHEVWWLVTPCNPLKNAADMLPLQERVRHANTIKNHRRIHVRVLEPYVGTPYTSVLLQRLKQRQPRRTLLWLMGSDSLTSVHKWYKWPEIFNNNKIAIFPRPDYTHSSTYAKAAQRFKRKRVPYRRMAQPSFKNAAWTTLHGMPMRNDSATQLRSGQALPFQPIEAL